MFDSLPKQKEFALTLDERFLIQNPLNSRNYIKDSFKLGIFKKQASSFALESLKKNDEYLKNMLEDNKCLLLEMMAVSTPDQEETKE